MTKLNGWNKGNRPPKSGRYLVLLGETENGDKLPGDPREIAQFRDGSPNEANWQSDHFPGIQIDRYITGWQNLPPIPPTKRT